MRTPGLDRRRRTGGLTLAIDLGQQGIECLLIDKKRLEDGWKATLTDQLITVRQAHKLELRLNGACRWEPESIGSLAKAARH